MPDGGQVTDLEGDVNKMRGQVKLTPSTANNWQAGVQGAPRTDWRSLRIGAAPPETLQQLRMDTERSILAACGVPPTLAQPSDGTFARESLRQFLHVAVQPLADQLADLIAQTFDLGAFEFSFDSLMASDLAGRARAFKQLVESGMDLEKAARLTNLLAVDDGSA